MKLTKKERVKVNRFDKFSILRFSIYRCSPSLALVEICAFFCIPWCLITTTFWLFLNRTLITLLTIGFVEMADNCVVCEHTLRRRRRHVLSEHFLETRRDFAEYILRTIEPPREVCMFSSIFFSLYFYKRKVSIYFYEVISGSIENGITIQPRALLINVILEYNYFVYTRCVNPYSLP